MAKRKKVGFDAQGTETFVSAGKSPSVFVCSETDSTGSVTSKSFKKELIKTGEYYKSVSEIFFAVTQEVLEHWVSAFRLFKVRGIKVPIPSSHWDLDNNNGYVRDMYIEGEGLFALIELFGTEAEIDKIVSTQDVSIYAPSDWTDGEMNEYIYPITHVALTPFPVIPGLKDFEAVAASLLEPKEKKKMDWSKVKKALGIDEAMTDENAETLMLSAIDVMGKDNIELSTKVKTLEASETTLKDKVGTLELSNASETPNPILVKLSAKNAGLELGQLVTKGRITPKVCERLKEGFIGAENASMALMLSSGGTVVMDMVIAALAENDPVVLGESSGSQDLELGDKSKPKANRLVADAQARNDKASGK